MKTGKQEASSLAESCRDCQSTGKRARDTTETSRITLQQPAVKVHYCRERQLLSDALVQVYSHLLQSVLQLFKLRVTALTLLRNAEGYNCKEAVRPLSYWAYEMHSVH